MKEIRRMSVLAALSLLAGCATLSGPLWSDVPSAVPLSHQFAPCSIKIPSGWVYLQTESKTGDVLVATDTGTSLQSIRVIHRSSRKAFPSIEKGASADMPVEQLSQRFIEDTTSRFDLDVVEIIESRPIQLDGFDGFRVHWQYQIEELRYQAIALGVARADGFYLVAYNAPVLHYFDHYQADFDAAVASFRFR